MAALNKKRKENRVMRKFVYGIVILAMMTLAASAFVPLVPPVFAAETKIKPSAADIKKMSTFLSNFTEQGFMNFDIETNGSDELLHMGSQDAAPDLIRFGIRHNYINNFKSRIVQSKAKNSEHGSLTIDGKYVAESVKKYFDLDLKNQSVVESDPPYYYDGKLYHFDGADGEALYYADVKEVWKDGNVLRMTGIIYDSEAMFNAEGKKPDDFKAADFEAKAKPYKFGGKDTWAILSMNVTWNDQ
jgi:hypothetical protein